MSDPKDQLPQEGPVTGHQSIREVMEALREAQQEELRQQALEERRQRREVQEKRIKERRKRQTEELRRRHARRESDLRMANTKMGEHIQAASRELRAALRDATSVPLPRHSPQGREQLRVRRSIENALGALRNVGRGTFHESEFEPDFEPEN